jgi:type IV secretory pathway VirB10-like protein
LRNIALIASSHERKKKKKDDKKEDEDGNEKKKKTDGDKEKSDEVKPKAITNEVSDGEIWINSLDVLKVAEEEKPDKDLKEEERDEDKDKKEEDEDEDEDEEEEEKEPDNWDVLGTVDAYNYPVVKGKYISDALICRVNILIRPAALCHHPLLPTALGTQREEEVGRTHTRLIDNFERQNQCYC